MKRLAKRFIEGPATDWGFAAGHWLLQALGRTWNVRFTGRDGVDAARFGGLGVLYGVRHGVLLPTTFLLRDRGVQALVSESRDGEIITRISEKIGFGCVRGSTSRGGGRAALRLAALGRQGYDLIITPDGPRGPIGSVAPGIVQVAARAGTPIVPIGIASGRAWRARSWDRFLIPQPGSRVIMNFQPPIRVAREHDEDEVREQVRRALIRAEEQAQSDLSAWNDLVSYTRIPA